MKASNFANDREHKLHGFTREFADNGHLHWKFETLFVFSPHGLNYSEVINFATRHNS